jgi:hypothetical protein
VVVSGRSRSEEVLFAKENPVVLFIEKTWFLWWMLAIVIGLRWFHLVSQT